MFRVSKSDELTSVTIISAISSECIKKPGFHVVDVLSQCSSYFLGGMEDQFPLPWQPLFLFPLARGIPDAADSASAVRLLWEPATGKVSCPFIYIHFPSYLYGDSQGC